MAPFPPTKICIIPASPAQGARPITAAALRKADIILTASDTAGSTTIRIGTWSAVSHAMLYDGAARVIEAVPGGVRIQPMAQALHGTRIARALRRKGLSRDGADYAIGYARELAMQGTGYDYAGAIVGIGLRILPAARELGINPGGGSTFYCSELVLRAFLKAGFPIHGQATMGSPGFLLEDQQTLEYVGHLRGARCENSITVEYGDFPGTD